MCWLLSGPGLISWEFIEGFDRNYLDFMGLYGDLMGFHGDLVGIHRDFMVIDIGG